MIDGGSFCGRALRVLGADMKLETILQRMLVQPPTPNWRPAFLLHEVLEAGSSQVSAGVSYGPITPFG